MQQKSIVSIGRGIMRRMDEYDVLPLHSWSVRKLLWLLFGITIVAVIGLVCAQLLRSQSVPVTSPQIAPVTLEQRQDALDDLAAGESATITPALVAARIQALESLSKSLAPSSGSNVPDQNAANRARAVSALGVHQQ
jgi:hypothetical protein